MNGFNIKERLIRNRINENLLKVKDEPAEVKSLLSLGVQTSKVGHEQYGHIQHDLLTSARFTSRKDLLNTCILIATSRNTVAQENIMDVVRIRLGRIKDKDYRYIANLIYLKENAIVDRVNAYLSRNLVGFSEMHKKYGKEYYGF